MSTEHSTQHTEPNSEQSDVVAPATTVEEPTGQTADQDVPSAGTATAEAAPIGQPVTDEAGEASGVAEAGPADGGLTEQGAGEQGAAAPDAQRGSQHEGLVREGEIAADFLETLLDIADLDGDLEVDVEGNRAAVAIVDSEDGRAPTRLVGTGGSVLEALQELTRLAVQAETGERSRLMLDVASYRADRRAALVTTAQQVIQEVKDSGERRELEPMTAFERKVVHDEVLAAGLRSESEGDEPGRFVVVLPGS